MAGGVFRGMIVGHTPRMGIWDDVPEFQKEFVQGIVDMGVAMRNDPVDAIIVNSTHYVSSFNWQFSTLDRHKGHCVAMEAPDLIGGEAYDYPGDAALGKALVEAVKAAGYPCVPMDAPHYSWDYATWVPVHYLDPDEKIPVVIVPVVLAAGHDESYAAGRIIHDTCAKLGKNVVFCASTALSHDIVRGPAEWPAPDCIEADKEFMDRLMTGKLSEAWNSFPAYVKRTVGEMGGRPLATLLGALDAANGDKWTGEQFGPYVQSSAAGNANIYMRPA
jgi:3,4-dihydroxyphenylacetate 2,3-dioxygenase